MIWTLEQYQTEASVFANYLTSDYPFVAYYEEAGELAGKLAKGYLHGDYTIGKRENKETKGELHPVEIIKELGDICWMTAMFMKENNIKGHFNEIIYVSINSETEAINAVLSLFSCPKPYALSVCTSIAQFYGYTLDEVLTINIEKLKARKDKGTIKGNGDNR